METKEQYLLEAKNLSKYFPVKNFFGKLVQEVRAVDRVNLSIKKGETFGLVGESGCGKSTLGRTLIRMYEPTDGILTYDGHDITKTKGKELLAYHKRMQIIFQDPYSALDPHQNVREIMAEPISVFEKLPEKEMDERIVSLLEKVGMKADDMEKYAYEFSGGQRQRIGIARALSVNPEFLLCDEPISALDVSIQAQVVNVLEDLQQELGLTYLFVAHDLSMVRHISDRIGVMYLGKIVESGESDEVYDNPCHPYTRALLASIPIPSGHSVWNTAASREIFRVRCMFRPAVVSIHAVLTRPISADSRNRNWKREHRAIWWHAGKNKKSEEQIEICFQKNITELMSRS